MLFLTILNEPQLKKCMCEQNDFLRFDSPLQWSNVTKNGWLVYHSKVMVLPARGFLRFLARL